MAKRSKPYIRCEKRDGKIILTLMASVVGGHALRGRRTVTAGDKAALETAVTEMIDDARSKG